MLRYCIPYNIIHGFSFVGDYLSWPNSFWFATSRTSFFPFLSVFVSPSYAFSPTPFTAFFLIFMVWARAIPFSFDTILVFLDMVWCNIYTWTCSTKNISLSKLNSDAMISCHISMRYSQLFIFYGSFKHSFI